MMVRIMQEILTKLDEIASNKNNEPLYVLGGYIVGATIVRDDAEQLFNNYPVLREISELGADLETLTNKSDATPVFDEFKVKLSILKNQL